ncbi:HAD domain-containing protein [Streptomyces sp. NPDC058953]|uniref:HAD domain-containing protein n=1 Tax=unclassified Streptomyces TaxID=2593676 RepID=UPI0036CF8C98
MRPLLLIDVDGPLNPYGGKPERRPEGYTTHRMRPEGWPGTKPLRVWLSPDHGRELLALAEFFDLVWATTWQGEANRWISPPLGLPELPFIDWPVMHGAAPRGTFWKTQYILDFAAGRPFAWVDDDITELDREFVAQRHLAAALLLHIDHRIGLTRPDFDALKQWATAL